MSQPLTKHQDDIRRGLRPKPKATKPKKARPLFLPYALTCETCGDLLVALKPRQFVSCKCGTNLDAGDGLYWRCGGKIDKVWRQRRKTKANQNPSWKLLDFPTQ